VNISIAGITFVIDSKDMPLLRAPCPPSYRPFLSDAISGHEESVIIDIRARDLPDTGQFTKIFDSNESWAMFRNGGEYLWANIPEASGGPICMARFERGVERATVYCNKELVSGAKGEERLLNPIGYPLDQLLLMYALSERQGALIHASGIDIGGNGYIFPGRSGAGKSTISRLFVSKGHAILSDDRIVVRKAGVQFRMFGTPWTGEAEIAENRSLPLRGIFFILQDGKNEIKELTPADAAERLMPVTSIPWYDKVVMSDILSFCEDMVLGVPAYELHFRPEMEAADLFEEFVSRRQALQQ
jgi:hypothetical protein